MLKHIRPAIISILLFTGITGIAYPLAVTGLAQILFPWKANGSLLYRDGRTIGSRLIGQPFSELKYFWSRPSATGPFAYNAGASTGSNYGPLNPALVDRIQKRIHDLRIADPQNVQRIPIDLVTASGSGLDPHLSVAGARYQVSRVARARNVSEEVIRDLVNRHTEGRQLGFLGESRVNVLELNLALDEAYAVGQGK